MENSKPNVKLHKFHKTKLLETMKKLSVAVIIHEKPLLELSLNFPMKSKPNWWNGPFTTICLRGIYLS